VRRGEVWWVEAPDSGRRPHLVLTRDAAIDPLTRVLGVPATRTIRGIASEVEIGPEDGMPDRCVLSLDNMRVLPKSYFVEAICTLGPEQMNRVCRALALATGCR
jgi:mRNA interferase MazF